MPLVMRRVMMFAGLVAPVDAGQTGEVATHCTRQDSLYHDNCLVADDLAQAGVDSRLSETAVNAHETTLGRNSPANERLSPPSIRARYHLSAFAPLSQCDRVVPSHFPVCVRNVQKERAAAGAELHDFRINRPRPVY